MSHHDHDDHHSHAPQPTSHASGVNYWEQQLQRSSLKEPPFIPKSQWIRPLSAFLTLEFKGNLINKN